MLFTILSQKNERIKLPRTTHPKTEWISWIMSDHPHAMKMVIIDIYSILPSGKLT